MTQEVFSATSLSTPHPGIGGAATGQARGRPVAYAWTMDREGRFDRLLGEDADRLPAVAPRDWLEWMHPDDLDRARAAWDHAREHHERCECEVRVMVPGQGARWHIAEIQPKFSRAGKLLRWQGSLGDIHDLMLAARELARTSMLQGTMLDACVDCIKIIDTEGRLLYINRSGCLALGVSEEGPRFTLKWLDLLPVEVRGRGKVALRRARNGEVGRFPGMSVVEGHPPRYWDNILTPVKDAAGDTRMILCVSRDVTSQREAERRLKLAGETEELTGLLNTRSFKAQLRRLMARARQAGTGLGLVLFDLDHFKRINAMLGEPGGDHVLRAVASRLQAATPAGTLLARIGGDEFALALDGIGDGARMFTEASRLLAELQAPLRHRGKTLQVGASIGCALFLRDGERAQDLLVHASIALKEAKRRGRGDIRMFDPRMRVASQKTGDQLRRAREMLVARSIQPRYQPLVDLEDGRTVGFEVLLRWHSPGHPELLTAEDIREAFDDFELAAAIGSQLREAVFADIAAWRGKALDVPPVSIRLAAAELLGDDFAGQLLLSLDGHGIGTDQLELVVGGDNLLNANQELARDALHLLSYAGVGIALDDFGAGDVSFTHLHSYPVRRLGISAELVDRIATDTRACHRRRHLQARPGPVGADRGPRHRQRVAAPVAGRDGLHPRPGPPVLGGA